MTLVKANYVSVCDPSDVESFAGINVATDLTLISGDIIQDSDAPVIVGGTATLESTGVIWLTFGDCEGGVSDGLNDNDFNTLEIVAATDAEVVDRNGLVVTGASVTNQLWLAAGDVDPGQLTLTGNLTAGSQILLQASNGVEQTGGVITTTTLFLGGDGANEASGDFNLEQNNVVDQLAAQLNDSLSFTNVVDLTLVKANYVSVCDPSDVESFAGINVATDLTLISGDIIQDSDAPVIVGGTATLESTGVIWLTFGDCEGGVSDGLNDNDFNTLEIVAATDAEVVDRNGLVVTGASVTNQLWLAAGDVDPGQLTLTGNLTAGSQILLQASNGVEQTGGVITTTTLFLGGDGANEASGDFNLEQNNVVDQLAAQLNDSLSFTNVVDLTLVKANYVSVCDPSDVESFAGINVATDLTLISGDIIQDSDAPVIVGGTATLESTGVIWLTFGDCEGGVSDGLNDNDFNMLEIVAATDAEVVDRNDLVVTNASVTNQLWLAAGDVDSGQLTLAGNLTAGSQILLQASNGVEQTGGVITTTTLFLGGDGANEASGDFNLEQNNVVDQLAAQLNDSLSFTNVVDLAIVKANYVSVCDPSDVESFAGINVATDLTLISGDIIQDSDAPVIVGGTATLESTGVIWLTFGDCDGGVSDGLNDNDFNTLEIVAATDAEVVDRNGLVVTGASVTNQLWLAAGDVDPGQLTLTGNLTAGSQILLQASNGVEQTGGVITTTTLFLGGDGANESSGDFNLEQNNVVDQLAAQLNDSLSFTNVVDLTLVKDNYVSVCDPADVESFAGINVATDLTLISGDIIQDSDAPVIVGGTATLESTGVIWLTFGDCEGGVSDGLNDNDFNMLEIVAATNAEIVDRNDLVVTGASVTNQLWLAAGDVDSGQLTLAGNLTAGSQILLQASNGVAQTGGVITTTTLLLGGDGANEASGDFNLEQNNVVDQLAAQLNDSLAFTNVVDLAIVKANYVSVCDPTDVESFAGINVATDLTLISGGIIQDSDAPVIVGGTATLESTGVVWLTFGDCDGGVSDGLNDNDFNTLEIVAATDAEVVDRNGLVVTGASVTNQLWLAAGDVDPGQLTLTGNLTAGLQILLQASNGVEQTGGVITTTTLFLGGDGANESSGDFNLEQNNVVDQLAAQLNDSLAFTNVVDLTLVKDNYVSVCDPADVESFAGINVATDLTLISGDIIQDSDAPVIVGGTATLESTGVIWLTFGDCVAGVSDGLNDNDFNTLVIVNAASAEVVDRNDLTVNGATVTNQLWLAAGDVDPGELTLAGNLTAGSQILLQASNGVTQTGGAITTTTLLLGGDAANESSGVFDLQQNNAVDQLAAELNDSLLFTNVVDLTLVKDNYVSVCDPADVESFAGINVATDLILSSGDIIQDADAPVIVGGTATLESTGDICLTFGDCSGGISDGINDNDFMGLVTATGSTIEIVDSNGLTAGNITSVNNIFLRSGDGGTGALTLEGNLTTTAVNGQVLLQSDSGVTQNEVTSVITTDQLLLGSEGEADRRGGDFVLDGINEVNRLAARLDASLEFVNNRNLDIGDLTYSSSCDTVEAICGVEVGGNLDIALIDSDLTQSAAVIVAGTTELSTGDGTICLTGGDCSGDGINDNDFVGLVTATGSTIEIVDSNGLTAGNISAVNNIFLRSGNGGTGALTLEGNLTTTAVNGQVLLQSDSGVTQNEVTSVITTDQLLLGSEGEADRRGGDFVLDGINEVNRLAARLDASLEFVNNRNLDIGDLTYSSSCDTVEAICGVEVGGNLDIALIDSDLTQSAAVIVAGTTELSTGDGTICLTGGDCSGDGINDNDFVGLVTATGSTIEIVDSNGLTAGNISAVNNIFLRSGNGGTGALTLEGNLTTTAVNGQVLLQSDSGVTQNEVTSVITTDQLLLGSEGEADRRGGDFVLDGINEVNRLAARLDASLEFVNNRNLDIGDLTYSSSCDTVEAICGVEVGGNLDIALIDSDLTQSAAVIVAGTTELSTGDGTICLTGGDCSGDGINDNDFVGLVTATGSTIEIVDSNGLTAGNISAVNNIFLRSGNGGTGALTLEGNLTTTAVNGQVLLQSDSGVTQNEVTSVITTDQLLLGSEGEADRRGGDFVLDGINEVNRLAARLDASLEFVNNRNLDIGDLTYSSSCDTVEAICGVEVGGNLDIALVGLVDSDLTQSAAVIVAGTTELSTGDGTICLTGGDCSGDGINDNDFVGPVTATGSTVEIVDSNDLTVGVGNITAVNDIFLRSGDGATGALTLQGNLRTTAADGQVLLQSDSGVTQAAASVITSRDLLVGSSDELTGVDRGSGAFLLTGNNVVQRVAGNLAGGSFQLVNTNANTNANLTIDAITYSSDCGTEEMFSELVAQGDSALDTRITLDTGQLSQTIQADPAAPGDAPRELSRFNENFEEYLTGLGRTADGAASDIGIAISNSGSLTTNVDVTAVSGDVLLQTQSGGDITVNSTVEVSATENHILVVAGDELTLNGALERGTEGRVFNVSNRNPNFDPDNRVLILDPGPLGQDNALVNTTTFTQDVEFIFGEVGESNFDTAVFFGITEESFLNAGLNFANLPEIFEDSLTADDRVDTVGADTLRSLLFDAGDQNFQSRSFFFDPSVGGVTETVTSQPFGVATLSAGMSEPGNPEASFTREFLTDNPEFRNVMFVFNDPGINIFQNASVDTNGDGTPDGLEDLNVAVEDFVGLARVGTLPVFTVNSIVFDVQVRVEAAPEVEPEFVQTVLFQQETTFVQEAQEKFFVVVYFSSQQEADKLQGLFDEDELDYDSQELQKLLNEFIDFKIEQDDNVADANSIRKLLENAELDLDLEDQDDLEQWENEFQQWLKNNSGGDDAPDVPRGLFKIIEVENGKASVQGDDVDRQTVPRSEPQDDDIEEYEFDRESTIEFNTDETPADELPSKDVVPVAINNEVMQKDLSPRMERWHRMLASDGMAETMAIDDVQPVSEDYDSSAGFSQRYLTEAGVGIGLLAVLCNQRSRQSLAPDGSAELLEQNSSDKSSRRNLFSRAARFGRRNAQRIDEQN